MPLDRSRNKENGCRTNEKERVIERRKTTCVNLFDRFKRKSFLHRIVNGDEKWIYFDNPKRKKSWTDPGQPSTLQPGRNIHGKKALPCMVGSEKSCVLWTAKTWWNCYWRSLLITIYRIELSVEAKTTRIRGQNTQSNFAPWQWKASCCEISQNVFRKYWIARATSRAVFTRLSSFWLVLISIDAARTFRTPFNSYKEVKNWIDEWLASKDERWYWEGIHQLLKRWKKVIDNDGQYFDYWIHSVCYLNKAIF